MQRIHGFPVFVSDRPNKKYYIKMDNKKVYFGAIKPDGTPYEQYHDKIGHYSEYDHKDKKRRERYRKRHKEPGPAFTPSWLSWHYLW